ncbi:hypothetical protein DASC09_005290 [Saccharomycopsis crataegensis]|uniref:ATP synthase F0 subunit 6 n=1 Tax=Saccharomycopsis crataegensis TaxID=43959 RepID=A0AAV5QEQ7_9ASCO|nr:hypothetical protein DASC09_005290 [Saccharomycopsis crataegensis]
MPSYSFEKKHTTTALTTITLILSAYSTLRYLVFGKAINENDPFDVGLTPFTGSIIIVFLYWMVMFLFQALFIIRYFVSEEREHEDPRQSKAFLASNHFMAFNTITFFWTILFGKGYYFFAELLAIANFLNITSLIIIHKTYITSQFSDYFLIHVSTAALPFSWLLYLIFWNGAAVFRSSTGLIARILANIFIWNFLFVPVLFIVFFGDWAIGLSSSLLMFGLGIGQIATKVFALQWIFAFIISGILALFSLIAFVGYGTSFMVTIEREERAPLLSEEA